MLYLCELLGVAAFAISGVMAGRSKRPDIIGAVVLAFVTALGGGIIRDAIIGRGAATFKDPVNFYVIICASFFAILLPERIIRFNRLLLIADAIGLGAFTAGAVSLALIAENIPYPFVITLAAITGCGGGMIRDTLLNEIPLVLRREIYLSASVAGAIAGIIFYEIFNSLLITVICVTIITVVIRLLAIHYSWSIPLLREKEKGEE